MESSTDQNKLIKEAKFLSQQVSSSFNKFINTKMELLFEKTSWPKLWDIYDSSLELDGPFFKIFTARKNVELHLQSNVTKYNLEAEDSPELKQHVRRMIPQSTCSSEILTHFWDLWKDQVLNALSCLQLLHSSEDGTFEREYLAYEDFCLEYLWVRNEKKIIYMLHSFLKLRGLKNQMALLSCLTI